MEGGVQREVALRQVMARNCASQVATYQKQRKAKRALRRRALEVEKRAETELVVVISLQPWS
jgi:hypothetical protein